MNCPALVRSVQKNDCGVVTRGRDAQHIHGSVRVAAAPGDVNSVGACDGFSGVHVGPVQQLGNRELHIKGADGIRAATTRAVIDG